jgi:hypothetical protein
MHTSHTARSTPYRGGRRMGRLAPGPTPQAGPDVRIMPVQVDHAEAYPRGLSSTSTAQRGVRQSRCGRAVVRGEGASCVSIKGAGLAQSCGARQHDGRVAAYSALRRTPECPYPARPG